MSPPKLTAPRTLLLVEDDPLMRWALVEEFARAGFQLMVAHTVGAALGYLQEPVDIAVIDDDLPDGCGSEVLERLHRRSPDCPVVILTAWRSEPRERLLHSLGAASILEKPIEIQRLVETLRALLDPSHSGVLAGAIA